MEHSMHVDATPYMSGVIRSSPYPTVHDVLVWFDAKIFALGNYSPPTLNTMAFADVHGVSLEPSPGCACRGRSTDGKDPDADATQVLARTAGATAPGANAES
jgi:hypothetical protein